MTSIEQEALVKLLLMEAVNAEELLLQKYQTYSSMIKDQEFGDLMNEFSQNAQEHINLLKNKMQRLSML